MKTVEEGDLGLPKEHSFVSILLERRRLSDVTKAVRFIVKSHSWFNNLFRETTISHLFCRCWLPFLCPPNLQSQTSLTLLQKSMAGCSIRALWILNNFDSVVFSRFPAKLRSSLLLCMKLCRVFFCLRLLRNMYKNEIAFVSVPWRKKCRWVEL